MKKHFSALALSSFILSACNVSSDPTEDVESTSDDLKFYPISINPLAGKPMSGSWSKTSGADNDSTVCRECSYTNHSDFPHDQYPLAFDFNTWKASFPRFGSSTGMPEALTEGKAIADDLIGGSYNSALEENLCYAWAYLAVGQTQRGGSLTPSVSKLSHSITVTSYLNSLGLLAPQAICGSATLRQEIAQKVFQSNQAWALAFPPQYARHLKSQYLPSGLGYSNHVYAEPECLAEMDGRASKSYCSMREAAQRAGGSKLPLGNHQIGQFLFWEVGKVDGNLRFLPPSKIKEIDPYPNTKAYVIPMVVSGAVNPLTGPLLPEFSDLTHPLVWVTADGQYESQEVWGKTGVRYVGTWPNIHLEPVYGWTKRYDNMAHADYLAGRSRTARIALQDVTLFTIWEVLNVNLGVSMDFELGVPKTDHELRQGAAPTRSVNLDPSQGTVFASDGQIKRGTSTVGWPPLYVYGPNGRNRSRTKSRSCSGGQEQRMRLAA
ncbi:MAG: hypothetical protein R3B89_12700 [Polyangiaceae bacterium]